MSADGARRDGRAPDDLREINIVPGFVGTATGSALLEAGGGTRCAAVTGGYVALELALRRLVDEGKLTAVPLTQSVAAVSCGIVGGRALLDLDYSEDSGAEVDANIVMTGDGGLVEVQATAERTPVSRASLDELLAIAEPAIGILRDAQERACAAAAG